jgi:hypothetical protein
MNAIDAQADDVLIEGIVRPIGWSGERIGHAEGAPWPVPLESVAGSMTALRRILTTFISHQTQDPTYNALRLAAYHFSVAAAAVAEIALAIEREHSTGLVLTGAPEIDWLRGKCDRLPKTIPRGHRGPSRSWLRTQAGRIARAASWSAPARMPQALLYPDAVAVTHNTLLRAEARRSRYAIGFCHADDWFADSNARSPGRGEAPSELHELAETVALSVARAIGVNTELEARVGRLLAGQLRDLVEVAWFDLRILESACLPTVLWSGTGGNWSARALGIEVLRRGGSVRRFDHGCGFATVVDPLGARLIELCVSTEFVAATPTLADILRAQVGLDCSTRIEGGHGDPHYRRPPGPVRRPKQRPRVMYVTGAIFGVRRLWPAKMADFGYLDWQLRVAKALQTLDIELILKPHPEGLFRGRKHPLSRIGRIETRRFEDVLDEVDVVIFDEPTSTTFWVAVASNCRVVLLNTSLAEFDPHIWALIQSRVVDAPVRWDDRNCPQFDIETLHAAIHDRRAFDPVPLRRILTGDEY